MNLKDLMPITFSSPRAQPEVVYFLISNESSYFSNCKSKISASNSFWFWRYNKKSEVKWNTRKWFVMYFHNSLIPRGAYFLLPLESKQEDTSGWNFTKCISEVNVNHLKVKNILVKMGISTFKWEERKQKKKHFELYDLYLLSHLYKRFTLTVLNVQTEKKRKEKKKSFLTFRGSTVTGLSRFSIYAVDSMYR